MNSSVYSGVYFRRQPPIEAAIACSSLPVLEHYGEATAVTPAIIVVVANSLCFDRIYVLLHCRLYHSPRGALWRLHRCGYPASLAALEEATNTQPLVYYEAKDIFKHTLGERTGSPLR